MRCRTTWRSTKRSSGRSTSPVRSHRRWECPTEKAGCSPERDGGATSGRPFRDRGHAPPRGVGVARVLLSKGHVPVEARRRRADGERATIGKGRERAQALGGVQHRGEGRATLLEPGGERVPEPRRVDEHLPRCASARRQNRSEEHTSELQSPCNLVCRLLLEKKKKNKKHM